MKKSILLLGLLFFAFNSIASHYLGGSVSWEKTSNGQFIFEVKIYRDCGAGGATYVSNILHGPNGNITLSTDTVIDISPNCVSCGVSMNGIGATALHVLKSAPVTLQGTPPASGWSFYWMDSARPSGTVNTISGSYFIESRMYPGYSSSSPSFVEDKAQVLTNFGNTYKVSAIRGNAEDSLYYKFAQPKEYVNSSITYTTGYSYTSPFPNNLTDASNGPVSIDGNTGLITYDIQVGISGYYSLGVAAEQWHNGVLIGEVFKEILVYFRNNATTNSVPAVDIDTSANGSIVRVSPTAYKTFASPGDTVSFEINAVDMDMNSSTFLPQTIAFSASGSALSTSWGGLGAYTNKPSLNPVAPQTSFVSAGVNKVNFNWSIQNEHYNPYNNSHFFTFTFDDDECYMPGVSSITLQVVVQKSLNITDDTVQVCAGGYVVLNGYSKSGNYLWSPSAGLSSDTVANPVASPGTSGYYYLTDPTTNEMDSVYVEVTTPAAFTLAQSGSYIKLTDGNPVSSTMWYYNGIPFYYPYDSLYILGYGDYWVKGTIGGCTLISDTVNIGVGTVFSVSDPSKGSYIGTNSPVAGSQGITFNLSQSANLQSVSIPGLVDLYAKKSSGYDLNLKIYDANQTEVFTTDITLQRPMDGLVTIPVNYSLAANTDYTIAVSGDSAYTFSMFENVSYPMTPFHNGITVKGSYEGSFEQFPTQPSNYLLPFSLNTDVQVVSLEETGRSDFRIYPNPVANQCTIDGLKGETEIQLIDLNGKLIAGYSTQESSIVIERGNLSAGVYFVKVSSDNSVSIQKVMFE